VNLTLRPLRLPVQDAFANHRMQGLSEQSTKRPLDHSAKNGTRVISREDRGTMAEKHMELLQRLEAGWADVKSSLTDDDRRALDLELDQMLKSIANCNTFEAAEPFLQELGDFQLVLATLVFKHEVELSNRQREIVREYDRCDMLDVWRGAFQKIRNAEFPWRED
jgi:hypothetical protein